MKALPAEQTAALKESLRNHYFTFADYFPDPPDIYFATAEGAGDLQAHAHGRLEEFRLNAIPWIDSFLPLEGKRILEVGCGTGSSTVALTEQGATVVATDVHAGSLQSARDRVSLYGLDATFEVGNALDLDFEPSSFDAVAFFAVLEHMTLHERISAIENCWNLIRPGGYMIVIETPNRLWPFDLHTAQEHHYLWLPDDLAALWAPRTPRERFNKIPTNDPMLLARWGRGVSYHDFCIALDRKPIELPVVSCLDLFYRDARNEHKIYAHTWWRRYEDLLHSLTPEIHRGFFQPWLNISLQKPG